MTEPLCPECGSVEVDANTWEAWCADCGGRWTEQTEPDRFAAVREAVLDRRERVGAFFDDLITTQQAAQIAGVKPATLREYARDGRAPAPIKMGAASMWSRLAIEAWAADRPGQGARTDLKG